MDGKKPRKPIAPPVRIIKETGWWENPIPVGLTYFRRDTEQTGMQKTYLTYEIYRNWRGRLLIESGEGKRMPACEFLKNIEGKVEREFVEEIIEDAVRRWNEDYGVRVRK